MVQDIIFTFSVFVLGSKGTTFAKKISPPSCFRDSRHPFLKYACTLSPDYFDGLSSNVAQSLILLMGRRPLILGKID